MKSMHATSSARLSAGTRFALSLLLAFALLGLLQWFIHA